MKKSIFVSWLGFDDPTDWGQQRLSEHAELDETDAAMKVWGLNAKIKEALNDQEFDAVHLFSTHDEKTNRIIKEWLGTPAVIHSVKIDVNNSAEVAATTGELVDEIIKLHPLEKSDLYFHVNCGNTIMIATLYALGYQLYQETQQRVTMCYTNNAGKLVIPTASSSWLLDRYENADQAWARAAMGITPEEKNFKAIIGDCVQIRKAVISASKVAKRHVSVLLLGESGVGKELFAEAIHNASGRKGRFIAINAAAIPSELFESELFGAIKGAGSGSAARAGYFKEADGGTLFMDEIGEVLPHLQSKLLRAIQSAEGSSSPTKLKLQAVGVTSKQYEVDVRIITATNRNLLSSSAQSSFRKDLYYRLATFPILIPPLRERGADVIAIAKHLLNRINEQFSTTEPGFKKKSLAETAQRRLKSYHWPGNVRELNAVLTRAVIMATGTRLEPMDIEQAIAEIVSDDAGTSFSRTRGSGFELEARLDAIQKTFIEDALDEVGGNQRKAADLLGIKYLTLNRRVNDLKIRVVKTNH